MNHSVGAKSIQEILRGYIISTIKEVIPDFANSFHIQLEHPVREEHGDYSTNIAFEVFGQLQKTASQAKTSSSWKNPRALATLLADKLNSDRELSKVVEKIEVAGGGFINFFLSPEHLATLILEQEVTSGRNALYEGQKILIEYAHPNTHKEMHIGHMRTLITGEALARILEQSKARVFRANYQGDIGPHVAKALFGIRILMEEKKLSLRDLEKKDDAAKAHFLGEGYVKGNQLYDASKIKIDTINTELYNHTGPYWDLYRKTRQWSLEYYNDLYRLFSTHFDRLFFESEMAECGKDIVRQNLGTVFKEDGGTIIFPGEEYGLHTRVFVTQAGNPTYEGKEMCNAYKEYESFPFDQKIHVVASEQAGYFQVVFKALELMDPQKFANKQYHVSMGMVQLADRKMSSRTGEIITVDSLIDEVKENVAQLIDLGRIASENREQTIEAVAIGAIKYSVLRVGTAQDAVFNVETSISLSGDSGPYLQYTVARCRSVLNKLKPKNQNFKDLNSKLLNAEELAILRWIYRFPEVTEAAALHLSPNLICGYLFELAQRFNLFYQKHSILKAENDDEKNFRLTITQAVNTILSQGLNLLGIEALDRM